MATEIFACHLCSKSFPNRSRLNQHLKTHSKPYSCTVCGRGFALRLDLNRHVKARHRIGLDRYPCPLQHCGYSATRKDNIRQHIEKRHRNQHEVVEFVSSQHNQIVRNPTLSHEGAAVIWDCKTILRAAELGNVALLQKACDIGVDINVLAEDQSSALHCAAKSGQYAAIHFLVERGAKIHARNDIGKSPLQEAISGGCLQTVQALLKSGANFDHLNTTVQCLAKCENTDILQHCLDYDDQIFTVSQKYRILEAAVRIGRTSIVRIVLAHSDTRDRQEHSESTATENPIDLRIHMNNLLEADRRHLSLLSIAAARGYNDIVQMLIENDFLEDHRSFKALAIASRKGHCSTIGLLLRLLPNDQYLRATDWRGWTYLHYAAHNGQYEAVGFIIRQDSIDVSCQDREKQTPLHRAALQSHWEVVLLLLEYTEAKNNDNPQIETREPVDRLRGLKALLQAPDYFDINSTDKYEYPYGSLLHKAAFRGDCEVLEILLDHEDINVNLECSYSKDTPLVTAAERGEVDAVRLLLQHKDIDVNLCDRFGRNPLYYARRDSNVEIIELLLSHGSIDSENVIHMAHIPIAEMPQGHREERLPVEASTTIEDSGQFAMGLYSSDDQFMEDALDHDLD